MSRYFDDELYHWKYKDKYKKGDHWVYIYDDGSTSEQVAPSLQGRSLNYNGQTGEITRTNRYKVTNPSHLFNKKRTEVIKEGKASKPEITNDSRRRKFTEVNEYTEYGRIHMERMNLERKLSTLKLEYEAKAKKGKSFIDRFMSRFSKKKDEAKPKNDGVPEGAKKAIEKFKAAKRKAIAEKAIEKIASKYDASKKELESQFEEKARQQSEAEYKRQEEAASRERAFEEKARKQAEDDYRKRQQAAARERAFEEQSRMQSEEQYRENERNARRRQNERNKAKRRQEEERRRRRR